MNSFCLQFTKYQKLLLLFLLLLFFFKEINKRSLIKLLKKINGVILPGGFGNYQPVARVIVKYARAMSKRNKPFPVLGICLGAQILMKIETDEPILKATDSQNIPLPLDFFEDEWKKSQLFGKAPNSLIQVLKTKAVTYNCLLYTSPSPRDATLSRMPSSA